MVHKPGRKLELNKPYGLPVERCNDGKPLIEPSDHWWENGVTFNAASVYLEPSEHNDNLVRSLLPMRPPGDPDLEQGVVAVYYRARPELDPGSAFTRSFIGLALFTPDLRPLYRYREPVLFPSPDPDGFDHYGVEDPRITRFGDLFAMVYCGVEADPEREWKANLCLAVSKDLLHWDKLGVMPGDVSLHNNKDGVLFPDLINGKYYLLHRPFHEGLALHEYAIRLASAHSLDGPWVDEGEALRSFYNPKCRASWVGAGSVPIRLIDGRYLVIYHTGNYLNEVDREYDLGAALFEFQNYGPSAPSEVVVSRLEPLMVPETPAELRSHSQLQVGNVLFACGSYEYEGWIYIIYGGADTYTLAARVRKTDLIRELERSGLENPFI